MHQVVHFVDGQAGCKRVYVGHPIRQPKLYPLNIAQSQQSLSFRIGEQHQRRSTILGNSDWLTTLRNINNCAEAGLHFS